MLHKALVSLSVMVCMAGAVAAPTVRSLGGAKPSATIRASGAPRPIARAATSGATNPATNIQSTRAIARSAAAPRLSVGRLHTNAGKSVSNPPTTSGGGDVDLTDYAKISDLDSLQSRMDNVDETLADRIDGLMNELDSLALNAGEKGDKGDPGEKGDKGDKGEKGDKGDTIGFPTADSDGLYLVRISDGAASLQATAIAPGPYSGN